MSESLKGIEPGIKGKANAKFPRGTMAVDAINKTLADPNLIGTDNGRQEVRVKFEYGKSKQFTHFRI